MAIGRITGPMLVRNLERQGVDLAVEGNLIYFNVNDRFIGVNTDVPQYYLDVNGNVFAGNTLTVGYEGNALYRLPTTVAPNVGSIVIAGNILNTPHDVIWSNVLIVDQEKRFVGIDKSPEYKLDIDGNLHVKTDANIDQKLWVGQLVTVGNLYTLPTTTPTKNSYLMARGGTLSETVWVPGPDEVLLRRRRYCKVIDNLPGYGQYEFVMNLGITNIVYEITVSRPVKVEIFSTPGKTEPNPYTFIATPDHLVDDGTVYLNDGSSYQSRQYSILANLEDPPKNSLYVTVTSIDQHLANLPVILTFWYFPALLDNGSNRVRFGVTLPVIPPEGGEFFFKIDTKQLYIFYDGSWTLV